MASDASPRDYPHQADAGAGLLAVLPALRLGVAGALDSLWRCHQGLLQHQL
nr:MAG TPA: hypothetical protein [Caudoviricetes sp.]